MINGSILIVDDNEEILVALKMFLEEHFSRIEARTNPRQALECLRKEKIDVYILDMNFRPGASSGREGIELMQSIRRTDPQAVVVFITAYGDVELAIQAMKSGANDFIQKPWDDQKLLATVRSAMELSKSRRQIESLRERQRVLQLDLRRDHQMVYGESRAMAELKHLVEKVAATPANVIILGENGTGKELVAEGDPPEIGPQGRGIHQG